MSLCPFCGYSHDAPLSDSVPVAPGTDATPDGRGVTSRRDRAGTIPAADILAGFDSAYPWWARYRGQLAALRDAQGKKPQPGRHAARDSLFFVANAEMQAAHDGLMSLSVRP